MTYSYDANDRLQTDTYDANGNTTTNSAGDPYGYDFENHLTNYKDLGAVITYDGDGNRVKEKANGVTTLYLVDTRNPSGYAQVVEELTVNGATTDLSRAYTYGLSLISQRQPGVSTNFFVYDGHGSTRLLTDSTTNVVNSFTYDAYGTVIASNAPPQTTHLYCGELIDPNFGLYYLRARYMNTATGRFWTRDTYEGNNEGPLSLHKYLYAMDDPVNHVDPSGNDVVEMLAVISIGAMLDAIGTVASAQEVTATVAPISSGTWKVFADVVPSTYGKILTLKDRDDHGFQVQYTPTSGGGGGGSVELYQTIAESGVMLTGSPHVDVGNSPNNTAAKEKAATGCGLPPTVNERADSTYSYWDSPTDQKVFHELWKITAVAVRRSGCKDTLLSTDYFEFDNDSRKITKKDASYRNDYNAAMKAWNQ